MNEYLEEPWRSCFELAWDAFCAGGLPVGAVVTDGSGGIVARGRNRRTETEPTPGQLSNTTIAHAEINALAALLPGNYSDHILYATLEPCLLCTTAAAHLRIGRLRFASADPQCAGVARVPELVPYVADRWPIREGPISAPLAKVSELLSVVQWLRVGPESKWLQVTKEQSPDVYEAGVALADLRKLDHLTSFPPAEAFAELAGSLRFDSFK